ncbi:MAG: Wzz/FepE/Etk N-terminal domain-containing protein [Reichenbachiella sp.]
MSEERKLQEDEIDLIELAKTIWAGRNFIVKVTVGFILFGLLIAFTSPVEYEASIKLLPESQESGLNVGGLGGLAGLAGINLGSISTGGGVLSPQLYPEIVNSLPLVLELFNDTLTFENEKVRTTSKMYFKEYPSVSFLGYVLKYSIGLPGLIKNAFITPPEVLGAKLKEEFLRFSRVEWNMIEGFKKRIKVSLDEQSGIITISSKMPDALAAAQLTKKVELLITEAVIKYKTDKAISNLKFIEETFGQAKAKFEYVQLKLAKATDRNRNVSSSTAQIELRKMENEYDVAFEVYKGLASQVEQAKIKLKEETPVFTVLEPVRIPEKKSEPNRPIILILFSFIGILTALSLTLLKNFLK